jgi:hypothetical protein
MTADNGSARSIARDAPLEWGLAEMLGLVQERQHALTGPELRSRYLGTLLCHPAAECSLIRSRARRSRLVKFGDSARELESRLCSHRVQRSHRVQGSHRGCTGEL